MHTARDTMTPRERWLAALDMEAVDRLPFWPKLGGNYSAAQKAPFRDMSLAQIHQWIGSDCHEGVGLGIKTSFDGWNVRAEAVEPGPDRIVRRSYGGPGGVELTSADRFDEASGAWHPVEFPVKTPDDIDAMRDFYLAHRLELDAPSVEMARKRQQEIGPAASTMACVGTSALMEWVQHLAGVENAHFFLADCPGRVEALFEAMQTRLENAMELAARHCPADTLYLIENTSTTLISPAQYRRYCAGHIGRCARIARAHGRRLVLHMCGHLRDLLDQLSGVGARAFEAYSRPPLGSATLAQGRAACPDVCFIGGTGAGLWLRPAEDIIAALESDLAALPHHRGLVITSAGVMPPAATPEKIRQVCQWVQNYPARMT
ncbi:MAG: uroporphyrinogen decarboxylase family protein [Planctomycetaceae bacterium]|nr:hypothetical protein [Planctomycetaceae bacterium]